MVRSFCFYMLRSKKRSEIIILQKAYELTSLSESPVSFARVSQRSKGGRTARSGNADVTNETTRASNFAARYADKAFGGRFFYRIFSNLHVLQLVKSIQCSLLVSHGLVHFLKDAFHETFSRLRLSTLPTSSF